MIQVDISSLQLEPQIKNKLDIATNTVRSIIGLTQKYDFIDCHDNLWRSTLNSLAQLTNNTENNCKCWYCECDGSAGFYFQVDHFRPKKRVKNKGCKKDEYEPGYWWLAFNPENYRVSCQKCNTGSGKNDQFPRADESSRAIVDGGEAFEKILLLDPTIPTDPSLLLFSQHGDVQAIPSCFEDDKKRVEISIGVYNLQARSKREGRRKIWKECLDLINIARQARDNLKESLLLSPEQKDNKKKEFTDSCERINRMTWRNAIFSSTAKSCIREYFKIERARAQSQNLEFDLDWLLQLI